MLNPSDPITRDDMIINMSEIRDRMGAIVKIISSGRVAVTDVATLAGEFSGLAEIISLVGHTDAALIGDDHWHEFATEAARDLYGEAVDQPAWDDYTWAADYRQGRQTVEYDNRTYIVV